MTPDTTTGEHVMLICTVRGCGLALRREGRRVICPRGHSFDVARSGYINLLQPQDRRSPSPGDSKEAVTARRRFLEHGPAEPLVARLAEILDQAGPGPLLDVGCGEGHHLDAFRRRRGGEGHGVDISVEAIDRAARKYRDCSFIVANADRLLPYENDSFAALTSITARVNGPEFRRILRADGILLVAVAGQDDLIELRQAILGEGKRIDRTESAIRALEREFRLLRQETLRIVARLDRQAIADVMTSSYRGMRTRERERLAALTELDVTLSRDVLLFEKGVRSEKLT